MSDETPLSLAKALVQISEPDSMSRPARNRHSLFLPRDSPDTESEFSDEDLDEDVLNIPKADTSATLSLLPQTNANNSNSLTSVYHTPPLEKVSKNLAYRTDPGKVRAQSHLEGQDTKKRRVSFFPSLEIQEYAGNEPYLVPLHNTQQERPESTQPDRSDEDPLLTTAHYNPSSPNLSFQSVDSPTTSRNILLDNPNDEPPRESTSSFYSIEIGSNEGLNSSLEIPSFIKEQLAEILKKREFLPRGDKSVVTGYAPLITPKKLTPVKKKMYFPPTTLDPLHHSLKIRQKRGQKSDLINIPLDDPAAVIPIAFIKKWFTKHTGNSSIPRSLSTWLQNYSTKLIEHLVQLIYKQSKKRKGVAQATPRDACLVMKKYLGLDDGVSIPNLIHDHLPMELWFDYKD